jgi:hypothetical protein
MRASLLIAAAGLGMALTTAPRGSVSARQPRQPTPVDFARDVQRADVAFIQKAGCVFVLASDAYATGHALVALQESRAINVANPAYQRGIRFLLGSQLEDGSWYVRTRAPAIQPCFDSDFPHGPDQFISAAATNWAAMALTTVVR